MKERGGIPIEKIEAAAAYVFEQRHRGRTGDAEDRPRWKTVSERTRRRWKQLAWAALVGAQQWERENQ